MVLEAGSPLSHVAIVARALDLPVVGRVEDITGRVEPGDTVVVDGDNAQVLIRPAEEIQQQVADALLAVEQRRRQYAALRELPAATRDGVKISLRVNAGLLIDLQHLATTGADGVGLYRTEITFMVRSQFPDVDDQAQLYRRVLDQADGKPVAFRTLDVGGDKVLPYVDRSATGPGDGLARDPHRPRSPGDAAPPVARHHHGGRRPASMDHVSHGRRSGRAARGASPP